MKLRITHKENEKKLKWLPRGEKNNKKIIGSIVGPLRATTPTMYFMKF